jgi:hypothetical protein
MALCGSAAVGLALLCGPSASAANGSHPPKPQVLWRAYPLDPTQTRPAGEVRQITSGAVSTRPASAPANVPDAAPAATRTFSTKRLVALGLLAVVTVGVILMLRRRRADAERREEAEPAGDGSSGRRRLFHVLSQEHGSLAAVRRADRRSGAAPTEGRSSPSGAGGVPDTLLEPAVPPSRPDVVKAERVEQAEPIELRPAATPEQPRPTADEKAALKRKTETLELAEAAKLKAKGQSSEALKDARQHDLTVLKAKLGGPQTTPKRTPAPKRAAAPKRAPAPKPAPAPKRAAAPKPAAPKQARATPRTPAPADPGAMAPASEASTDETNRPRQPTPTTSRCRIEWRRDGDESLFCAMVRTPNGDESVLLSSPSFEWKEDTPPSKELPQVGSAYLALVSKLMADGWVATGSGERWYALELKGTTDQLRSTNRQGGKT